MVLCGFCWIGQCCLLRTCSGPYFHSVAIAVDWSVSWCEFAYNSEAKWQLSWLYRLSYFCLFFHTDYFFTMRCYASTVCTVIMCPFVCPSFRLSQVGIVLKRLKESSWVLAWRFPSTYRRLCNKEILVSPKIRVLPLNFVPNPWLRKFFHSKSIAFQQNSS